MEPTKYIDLTGFSPPQEVLVTFIDGVETSHDIPEAAQDDPDEFTLFLLQLAERTGATHVLDDGELVTLDDFTRHGV